MQLDTNSQLEAEAPPIVQLSDVSVHYSVGSSFLGRGSRETIRALDGVSVSITAGDTLGVVGESGSGKSTLARVISGMVLPTSGSVSVDGDDLSTLSRSTLKAHRRAVQIVFQNPYSSMDPRMRVGSIIAEPVLVAGGFGSRTAAKQRVAELLALVGLPPESAMKYPHQFSGGQRQRIAIARALAPRPELVLLDEPTSALDVSVRAQILTLLQELHRSMNLTFVLISHDLLSVAQVVSKVVVMYLGRVVESGTTNDVFRSPGHPYTQSLLSSIPDSPVQKPRLSIDYEIPSAMNVPTGCRFKGGCLLRRELDSPAVCDEVDPALELVSAGHASACHFTAEASAEWSQLIADPETRAVTMAEEMGALTAEEAAPPHD